ncbi:DUF3263 domain-containing protein [Micromonospora sp. LOL_024]|uniref:DUF3263 domain-containing protein n=1 Tax=Micromonospora sp. LOL_024 TaxID=3345412 RepID=UPI003A856358
MRSPMQPADATPAAQTGPEAVTVPPPRSAPDVESAPVYADTAPQDSAAAPEDASTGGGYRPAAVATPGDLGEQEREILAFERQWWRHAGAKEQAIRDRFGLSATRYYQMLNTLLDNPAALGADPVLVGRLIRLRAARARNRRR